MGIAPGIWGPNLWGTLHLLCLAGTATSEFIYAFAEVIPCPRCAAHFKELINEVPFPNGAEPLELFKWSVSIHNMVNERIGKPIVSVNEALTLWTTPVVDEVVETPSFQFDFKIALIIVLMVIILGMSLYL